MQYLPTRVLYIDLSTKKFWIDDRKDLFERYLGGIGVASALYKEEVKPSTDPLSPDNVIIFAVGPLTGLYPMCSKTIAVFKSPLNNYFAESHAGGRSALAIRYAGYGAIVIKGASDKPIYLIIDHKGVQFRDASALWGMKSTETIGRVLREVTNGSGFRTIMRIGRAGEKLVRYANVNVDTYRHFGRMGLGAVFGSKKLKAIAIIGKRGFELPVKYRGNYLKMYKEIYDLTIKSPALRKYHDLGTAQNILVLNKLGALPTKNFQSGVFDKAEEISGEKYAELMLGRRLACAGCPVACIHLAALREPTGEPYFYKTTFISYDYELLYSLGSNLCIGDREGLLRLIRIVEELGLDAITTGVVLSWITEAFEKGIINRDQVILEPRWGDWKTYIEIVKFIVEQPNEFYKIAALGVDELAKRFGGEDFSLAINKVEPAGYHTGSHYWISLMIGSRHSHLDSGAYSFDEQVATGKLEVPKSTREIIERIVKEECWRQILNSLVVCLFARGIYKEDLVVKALNSIGISITKEDLEKIGIEIWIEKQLIKIREGFDPEKIRIPKRILEVETPCGKIDEKIFKEAAIEYKKILYELIDKILRRRVETKLEIK